MRDRNEPYSPPNGPLAVVYHDHELLAVDKPSGLLSVPGKGPELADCLIARVHAEYPAALLVHRLDRDTSGVMLFALSARAQRHIGLQFEKRQTKKVYLAEVWGKLEGKGRIDLPLIVDWPNRPLQKVCHETGKPAVTDWRSKRSGDRSQVELRPETGRSHQLRVHMLSLGHPILGDPFYADDFAFQAADRLMLHAWKLAIRHPDGGEAVEFRAKRPF